MAFTSGVGIWQGALLHWEKDRSGWNNANVNKIEKIEKNCFMQRAFVQRAHTCGQPTKG
jgi:hypothetical protein